MDPTVRIEDVELKRIADAGQTVLSADDWARVMVASAMIQKNPELATAFQGGIPEVSVFWTVAGVRLKCRFDYLKPQAIGDLKALGNTMGDPFPIACRKAIARANMSVQAAHYMNGPWPSVRSPTRASPRSWPTASTAPRRLPRPLPSCSTPT